MRRTGNTVYRLVLPDVTCYEYRTGVWYSVGCLIHADHATSNFDYPNSWLISYTHTHTHTHTHTRTHTATRRQSRAFSVTGQSIRIRFIAEVFSVCEQFYSEMLLLCRVEREREPLRVGLPPTLLSSYQPSNRPRVQ